MVGCPPLKFAQGLPAPLHGLIAIGRNRGVLTWPDKVRVGGGLLWPILGNQAWIDAQDGYTYADWHLRHGMGRRALGDFFDTMALALNFDTTERVSAKTGSHRVVTFSPKRPMLRASLSSTALPSCACLRRS